MTSPRKTETYGLLGAAVASAMFLILAGAALAGQRGTGMSNVTTSAGIKTSVVRDHRTGFNGPDVCYAYRCPPGTVHRHHPLANPPAGPWTNARDHR